MWHPICDVVELERKPMTWEEAIRFCEEHECEECPMVEKRTEYQKTVLQYPCCWNLVGETE